MRYSTWFGRPGWYVGLDPDQARIAFAKTPFLVYDLVVAGMCAFAVPVALALAMPWRQRLTRRLVGLFAWAGTGLLVLRSVASGAQTAYLVARGQFVVELRGLWELWFYLGAILFGLGTWRFLRQRDSPGADQQGARAHREDAGGGRGSVAIRSRIIVL